MDTNWEQSTWSRTFYNKYFFTLYLKYAGASRVTVLLGIGDASSVLDIALKVIQIALTKSRAHYSAVKD